MVIGGIALGYFKLKKEIIMDNIGLIKKTFEHSIGKEAYAIHKFDHVLNNQVFRIETELQPYIFKIYANRDWPEDGKLSFINQKLDEYQITHPKLFVFNRDDDHYPNGYLIEECLPGATADRLTDETKL
jgi:hypothetical protein